MGTAKTYSRTFCGSNINTTGTWKANVTVWDSSSPQQSKASSHTITINYYREIQEPTCGSGGIICP